MKRYVISAEARSDLTHIRDQISGQNPSRAITFLEELSTTFRRLAEMPLIGRGRDEIRSGLRSFVHGNYIVLYRLGGEGVDIVRVVHAKRHLPWLFGL